MKFVKIIIFTLTGLLAVSCANRAAGPTGGPKDSIPPVVVKTNPMNGIINYKKKEIQVYFDENITLDKANENVIVSPPQSVQPNVRGNAKLLTVSLQDDLMDSTTYSIFFGNAIIDLNEKNPLENYTFSFSTGPEIDTLQVSGTLYNAEDLSPLSGVLVGLHRDLSDSAIYKDKFVRITKTGTDGKFTVHNVKSGQYKIYALGDVNRDFIYQTGEGIAFNDSIIFPTVDITEKRDTVWKDSIEAGAMEIDTVIMSRQVKHFPDDVVLKLFKENKKRQYLLRSQRPERYKFSLIFNASIQRMPELHPLNFELKDSFLIESSIKQDSLVYWIPDSAIYNMDTLMIAVDYLKTDSLNMLVPVKDTLTFAYRQQKVSAPKNKKMGEEAGPPEPPALEIGTNLSPVFDIYNDIRISLKEPVARLEREKIGLIQVIDSLEHEQKFEWVQLDSIGKNFLLRHAWKPEGTYKLTIDSASISSLYGNVNKTLSTEFKIKSLEEYSTLGIVLESPDSLAMVQVLDSKDAVVRSLKAVDGKAVFEYLKPGDYFVRLYIDRNGNGQWDPGDLTLRLPPEDVYYFPKKLSLRANWEVEEPWNHLDPSYLNKKPEELKPAKKK